LDNRQSRGRLNAIVSGYVAFYQINKIFVEILYFIIDKIASRGGFDPRDVVYRPLI